SFHSLHLSMRTMYIQCCQLVIIKETMTIIKGQTQEGWALLHQFPMCLALYYRHRLDNKGPNTGGMGAFAPVPDVTKEIVDYTTTHILKKAAKGLMREGRPFTG